MRLRGVGAADLTDLASMRESMLVVQELMAGGDLKALVLKAMARPFDPPYSKADALRWAMQVGRMLRAPCLPLETIGGARWQRGRGPTKPPHSSTLSPAPPSPFHAAPSPSARPVHPRRPLHQIAEAVHYLHAVCRPMVIHRDLKLDNVLLTGGPLHSATVRRFTPAFQAVGPVWMEGVRAARLGGPALPVPPSLSSGSRRP